MGLCCFLVSVFDVYLLFSFTNKVACKLEKNKPNFALKSATATQAYITLRKKRMFGQRHSHKQLSQTQAIKYGCECYHTTGQPNTGLS